VLSIRSLIYFLVITRPPTPPSNQIKASTNRVLYRRYTVPKGTTPAFLVLFLSSFYSLFESNSRLETFRREMKQASVCASVYFRLLGLIVCLNVFREAASFFFSREPFWCGLMTLLSFFDTLRCSSVFVQLTMTWVCLFKQARRRWWTLTPCQLTYQRLIALSVQRMFNSNVLWRSTYVDYRYENGQVSS
jgi:hypothetical protein